MYVSFYFIKNACTAQAFNAKIYTALSFKLFYIKKGMRTMTPENAEILHKINAYAEKTLADIDPQKTPVSFQLETLKPVMEEIAKEKGMAVEDVFILYMDLASEVAVKAEEQFQAELKDRNIF